MACSTRGDAPRDFIGARGEEGAVERQERSMACRQEPDIGLISYETMSSNRRLEPPAAPQVQIKGIIPLRQVKE